MKFKEWFKNDKSKEEAHGLEKIARVRLFGKEEPYLDQRPPEEQASLLHKYPKTNDDSMADDAAMHSIIDKKEYELFESKEEKNEKIINSTLKESLHKLNSQEKDYVLKTQELMGIDYDIACLEDKIRNLDLIRDQLVRQAFGHKDDEYHSYELSKSESDLAALKADKERLLKEQGVLKLELEGDEKKLADATLRFKALTDKLDTGKQEDFEELN